MNTSILTGPHSGTLRRIREFDTTPPRILSKIDVDQQYYYGWPFGNKTSTSNNSTIAAVSSTTIATESPRTDEKGTNVTMCPPPGRTYCF